jgi:DNA-directed RNA polymerase subunit RPC12/RpoP
MKCPWCSRDVGVLYPKRGVTECPYCAGKVTYAFRGRKAVAYACGSLLLALLLAPLLGGVSLLLVVLVPLAASAYLERWY